VRFSTFYALILALIKPSEDHEKNGVTKYYDPCSSEIWSRNKNIQEKLRTEMFVTFRTYLEEIRGLSMESL
jgi:hypothetical protein